MIDIVEQLRSQLPRGMEHCTILFKECEQGHGRLIATNWVDHGCQQCEIERMRKALGSAQLVLMNRRTLDRAMWERMAEAAESDVHAALGFAK